MKRAARQADQMDLLGWQPPSIVSAFEAADVRAATLRDRIAIAVAETLKRSSLIRTTG